MKKLFLLLPILYCFTVSGQTKNTFNQRFYVDINADSVKQLMLNARTPEDTLFAIAATIDNIGDFEDVKEIILLIDELVQSNSRLKLIDTKPYELFRDGLLLFENNEKVPCIEKLKESIEAFDRQKKIFGSNSLFNSVRVYYSHAGLQDEKLKYFQDKLKYYKKNGPIENTAVCYHCIAGPYSFKADYNNAISNYLKSAEVFKSFSPMGYCNEICVVGWYYYLWGNYEKAEYYLQTGYDLCIETSFWYLAPYTKVALALVAKKKRNYNTALSHINEALDLFPQHDLPHFNKAICLAEKGGILLEMNMSEDAYKILKEAMAFRDSIAMPLVTVTGNFEGEYYLAKYYHAKGDNSNAEKQLLSAYRQATESKYDILILKYRKELASFYYETGKPEKAIPFGLSYISFRDSLSEIQNGYNIAQYEKEQEELIAYKELQTQKLVRNSFITGFAVVLLFAGVFFRQRNKTKKEKQRSDELLLNILPGEVADEIKTTGTAKAKAFTMVTVMFTDFKDFTTVSEKISAELLVDEIHTCFSAFDNILHKYKIEKIKTIGDAYLCASGLPVSNHTHAVDMLNAAFEIRGFMIERKKEKEAKGEIPFELRIGIHTGPVVAGIVGVKKYAYDIWGDTVNIAARMEQNSEAGKVNISGSTYELVKEKFICTHRGKIQAKNKGEVDMYFVELNKV